MTGDGASGLPGWSVQLDLIRLATDQQSRRNSVPGVYVLGLPWLWTWGSGRLSVGRDAGRGQAEVARKMANAAE